MFLPIVENMQRSCDTLHDEVVTSPTSRILIVLMPMPDHRIDLAFVLARKPRGCRGSSCRLSLDDDHNIRERCRNSVTIQQMLSRSSRVWVGDLRYKDALRQDIALQRRLEGLLLTDAGAEHCNRRRILVRRAPVAGRVYPTCVAADDRVAELRRDSADCLRDLCREIER